MLNISDKCSEDREGRKGRQVCWDTTGVAKSKEVHFEGQRPKRCEDSQLRGRQARQREWSAVIGKEGNDLGLSLQGNVTGRCNSMARLR